ncbi:YbhB/YbcL family Raf kinase inhibitor-like protein [Streptomyces sp. CB01881]|uniref:YbhB/YbcL family Raf kinase inhibitor-like protein n=1 Tax=Streptomyces sp. CB01881 TaxID=2078691 RepID=UPI000CDBBE31|nr:YbhB/YbcL family Raf kinase inhibitor-like protein [Streptomyces sp. CB01881]AUY50906.1 YbhB/YbcL family Raf kinase inhibitor-like protein [Streptomyces sp. CB01881]TYC74288.1 YbhB/YbcL family Raf kinase inhibitor-like protein [Streptomyces sp. CB01881]
MSVRPPLPYEFLPQVPSFPLTSEDITEGGTLAKEFVYSGGNLSPQLAWSGLPEGTRSIAVTCYDPDAPTGSGWWHWLALNLPAGTAALARGAGSSDAGLPGEASFHARNDFPGHKYDGAAPPPGAPHRYAFAVHALDVDALDVTADTPAAQVGFHITFHTLARAVITAEFGV